MSIRKDAYWTAADTVVTSGLAFVLRVIVARALAPEDFGLAMIAVTIIGILGTINDFGLTATLIQRDEKDVTPDLIDTTFTASLIITVVLAGLTAGFAAPVATQLYDEPELLPLLLALSVTLLPSPVSTVASALMFREGRFRDNAVIKVVSQLFAMGAAVGMLVLNPSPWVIVLQVTVASISSAVMLQIARPYRYRLRIVREHLGSVFGFSSFILLGALMTNAQATTGVFVLGIVLSATSVGYFAFAVYLTDTARKVVMSILNRVTFVHFSRYKNDLDFLRTKFVATVRWNCRALFPLMTAMMLFGPGWVPQFMGPAWEELGHLIFWLSATVIIGTAGGSTGNLFKSIGRPGLELWFTTLNTVVLLAPAMYFSARYFGLEGAAIATFLVKVFLIGVRMIYLEKLIPHARGETIRVSLLQFFLQAPIFAAWIAVTVLDIPQWHYQAPFLVVAFMIYGFIELPKAFPHVWKRLNRHARSLDG